jgi:hypothetical protein
MGLAPSTCRLGNCSVPANCSKDFLFSYPIFILQGAGYCCRNRLLKKYLPRLPPAEFTGLSTDAQRHRLSLFQACLDPMLVLVYLGPEAAAAPLNGERETAPSRRQLERDACGERNGLQPAEARLWPPLAVRGSERRPGPRAAPTRGQRGNPRGLSLPVPARRDLRGRRREAFSAYRGD